MDSADAEDERVSGEEDGAGFVAKESWNRLMPALFGLRMISLAQAVGWLLLSKLLLGGIIRHTSAGAAH